jgi:hypothetical protein
MILNSALLLLIRCFSAALLVLVGKKYFILYCACDLSFYMLQKLARRDFYHWLPIEGFFSVLVSFLWRLIGKTIVDYTGVVQMRAAGELGGIYWTGNMLLAVFSPIAVVSFYYASKPEIVVMAETTARLIVGALSGAWLVCFLLFLKLMKKEYRKTFLSLETGNDWAMSFFIKGNTDAKRVKPVRLNKHKWRKIRPEVKEFVAENWERWEEEEPDWFTDVWKSRLPEDWLPATELRRQKMIGGGQRRRSSLGQLMGESVRDRRGSATVVPLNEGGDTVGDADGVSAREPTTIARLPVKIRKRCDVDSDDESK